MDAKRTPNEIRSRVTTPGHGSVARSHQCIAGVKAGYSKPRFSSTFYLAGELYVIIRGSYAALIDTFTFMVSLAWSLWCKGGPATRSTIPAFLERDGEVILLNRLVLNAAP